MPKGGKRPGAGRPKGPTKPTLDKLMAREEVRRIVIENLAPMVEAQMANALGIKYLVTRDKKSGKFIRVTEAMARVKGDNAENEETIEVWEKDPNVQAFADLMNRALDKPKEQEIEVKHDGRLEIVVRKPW